MKSFAVYTATLVGSLVLAPAVSAEEGRTLTVSGNGTATAKPDQATLQAGVVTRAAAAKEALTVNNEATSKLITVLQDHGIDDENLQTARFDVRPIHERDEDGRDVGKIIAYEVTNQLHVKVLEMDRLGDVLDGVVNAGGNRVYGITFGLQNEEQAMDKARRRAVSEAQRRAKLYAEEADVTLGSIRTITEQSASRPRLQTRQFDAASARSVPVATGELEFQAAIQIQYELADAE